MNNKKSGKKVKALFLIPGFSSGGAERVLSIILDKLDRQRIEPVCIVYSRAGWAYDIPDDVKVLSLELPGVDSLFKKAVYALQRIFIVRRIISSEMPDVFFSMLSTVNLVAIGAALLSGSMRKSMRLYISVRTHPSIALQGQLYSLKKYLLKVMYPSADRIIVNSEGMKRDLTDNFGISGDKIDVIYNPLPIDRITELSNEEVVEHKWFQEDVPIIINVGSVNRYRRKGHDILLRAFKRVRAKVESRLVIVGAGNKENEEKLKRLAEDLGISGDVFFAGFQENPFKFIKRASVFVLSSRVEGFPNALIEAMACGVPVISTRCPSGPEEIITDTVDGLLVSVEDDDELAGAITRVIDEPSDFISMASEAQKRVAQFDARTVIKNYEDLFAAC